MRGMGARWIATFGLLSAFLFQSLWYFNSQKNVQITNLSGRFAASVERCHLILCEADSLLRQTGVIVPNNFFNRKLHRDLSGRVRNRNGPTFDVGESFTSARWQDSARVLSESLLRYLTR